jgi:hypothetical protein
MSDDTIAGELHTLFATHLFRVYTNPDVVGCEVAGALKNVMAIASGMADGLGTGDNTRAAVITRGLGELTRLGVAMGGHAITFSGLAGMGDLVATCISTQSRNRYVGEQLGKGRAIDDIIAEMSMVAEGVKTAAVVMELRPTAACSGGSTATSCTGWPARAEVPSQLDSRGGVLIGALARPDCALVGPSGDVDLDDGWVLDWWVGAEDRWHLPRHEASVRQHLVGSAPVVETAMHVPGGDVLHRAYVVHESDGDAVVVEIENRTAVPVAVALVARAVNPARARTVTASADALWVGGQPAVAFPRAPAQFADTARAGDIPEPVALAVFPLPHTASLRVVLPLGGADRGLAGWSRAIPGLPAPTQVAFGWRLQLRRGMRLEVPESPLAEAVDTSRAALLLADRGRDWRWMEALHPIVRTLDGWGRHEEAADLLRGATDTTASPGMLAALAHHLRLGGDPALVEDLLPAIASGVLRAGRSGNQSALRDAAIALELGGQPEAAASVSRRADRARSRRRPPQYDAEWKDLRRVPRQLVDAADFLDRMRDRLLREVEDAAEDGGPAVVLLPDLPPEWRSLNLEVHDAPTRYGRLSFALRWHGANPALLWELVPSRPGRDVVPVRLVCPAFDTGWSSWDPRGEVLLRSDGNRSTPPAADQGAQPAGGRPDEQGASFS